MISGYTGGRADNPTYRNHSRTGHVEAARIIYDPGKISYGELLSHFMTTINPLDGGGQFCDRGWSYTTAVFYSTRAEKKLAIQAVKETERILKKPVRTRVVQFRKFWNAEGYHQDYYKKNPLRYKYYRSRCGRDQTIKEVWQGKKLYLK